MASLQPKPKAGSIARALLVEDKITKVQFVGPVYFDPPLDIRKVGLNYKRQAAIIIGGEFKSSSNPSRPENVNPDIQLLLASAAGDEKRVRRLLHSGAPEGTCVILQELSVRVYTLFVVTVTALVHWLVQQLPGR